MITLLVMLIPQCNVFHSLFLVSVAILDSKSFSNVSANGALEFSAWFVADTSRDLQLEPDNRPKKVFKEIDVEYPDLDKKPYFEFPLRDRFIQERDTFKLTCTLAGFPQPQVCCLLYHHH